MQPGGSSDAERLARLEERGRAIEAKLDDVLARLDGPPWERSVRGRLHVLEGESQAARLASAQLADARAERRRAAVEQQSAQRARKVTVWRVLGFTSAMLLALYPYIAHFARWGG